MLQSVQGVMTINKYVCVCVSTLTNYNIRILETRKKLHSHHVNK